MPQSPRYVDKLLKVFTRQGEEDHFLLHVEVQGYRDNDFEQRMFQYFYRIRDHYQKPVAAIAILTDPHAHFRPGSYQYSYQWGAASYEYVVYKVLDQQEEALMKHDNPFAVIILTVLLSLQLGKASDVEILRMKEKIAQPMMPNLAN
jgi:predicted transposase YdaD